MTQRRRARPGAAARIVLAGPEHRQQVDARVDRSSLAQYYPNLVTSPRDRASNDALRAFADRRIAASARQATNPAIATIRCRTTVRAERLPAIDAWLARHAR